MAVQPSLRFLALGAGWILTFLALCACGGERAATETPAMPLPAAKPPAASEALATFGGGCFWCTEAVYLRIEGVLGARSGYAGGTTPNPTYQQVCDGETGHAEVIQVRFDPARVPYARLLEVFFKTHDPTTLNRQGADEGTQYRSIILTHDAEQRRVAEEVKQKLTASGAFGDPIVTQIVPFERFWPAEEYHQDYFARNPTQGYCRAVVGPKVEKFEAAFAELLKR
jgi:peptide-methionine (S)-S-oxide reductase